jgi:hypothetical protein
VCVSKRKKERKERAEKSLIVFLLLSSSLSLSLSLSISTVKHYDLPFKGARSRLVSFSSYPGNLVSGDDYFLTDTGLQVSETTNDVFNKSLYQYTTTRTVPYWVRITVATRLSTNAQQWIRYAGLYNSGTCMKKKEEREGERKGRVNKLFRLFPYIDR